MTPHQPLRRTPLAGLGHAGLVVLVALVVAVAVSVPHATAMAPPPLPAAPPVPSPEAPVGGDGAHGAHGAHDAHDAHGARGARGARGVWPLQPPPAVVWGFDPPSETWGSGHRGVDLAGTVGEPVHAAMAGTVSFVGKIAGVGMVVVDHGPTRTTYQPVAAAVHRGDPVAAGAVLGRLAWPGTHCPPQACLHWGWIRGTTYLDPLLLVGGGPSPVRLLPLTTPPRR